jgi:hypothetical protein
VLAAKVYELIARRLPEREAGVVRRIAQVEDRHRLSLEQRMRHLGMSVPDRESEMTLAGVIVGGATYLIGLALPT